MVRLTLGHVGHLVLAHGLESLFPHLALHLWGDTEEVEVASSQGYQAGEDGEDAWGRVRYAGFVGGRGRGYLGRSRASGPLCGAPCFARSHGVVLESWWELHGWCLRDGRAGPEREGGVEALRFRP